MQYILFMLRIAYMLCIILEALIWLVSLTYIVDTAIFNIPQIYMFSCQGTCQLQLPFGVMLLFSLFPP